MKDSTAIRTLLVFALFVIGTVPCALAQVSEILNASGDGTGNALDIPYGVAVDHAGNVFVAGNATDNVLKITSSGDVTEIMDASGDGAGNLLEEPSGVAVDGMGNVYVAGLRSDNAFKITPQGVVSEIIDSSGDGQGGVLDGAIGIAVDDAQNVYLAGSLSDNAFKIASNGSITEIIDGAGDGFGNVLVQPSPIAVDSDGNVYVGCVGSGNAFKITPDGLVLEIVDVLLGVRGLAVDGLGNLYVSGTTSDNLLKVTPTGVISQLIGLEGDGEGNLLDAPFGVTVDSAGNVYVTARLSHNAFQISPGGKITQILDASGDGVGNILDSGFYIAVDEHENVFVTGIFSDNVFKIEIPSDFPALCTGDGGNQLGCTDCPCGNDASSGREGGCTNSVGKSARLIAKGSASVSLPAGAVSDLRFSMIEATPLTFSILNSGDAIGPTNPLNPCFGLGSGTRALHFDGLRCAVLNTRRHGGRATNAVGGIGIGGSASPWGGEGNPQLGIANAGSGFVSGQTRYFQAIYRDDVSAVCMTGLNTTQAIEVTFTP